jgi:hypothetical protein
MSPYVHEVRGPEQSTHHTSLRAAKSAAAALAREGAAVDVVRWIAGRDGKPQTNIGRVHTSFPPRR